MGHCRIGVLALALVAAMGCTAAGAGVAPDSTVLSTALGRSGAGAVVAQASPTAEPQIPPPAPNQTPGPNVVAPLALKNTS
ncbi:MAG: hypothetical protein IRZ14_20075 [Chloroflexi bacterium]|nr:hypothetical protein [Chloroflexota bacterium]